MYADNHQPLQTEGVDANTFEELADKALELVGETRGLAMVCGPITTGGTDNQVYNFQIMSAVVAGLERQGKQLFNQMPYELGLRKLLYNWETEGNTGYCMPILTVFYARLFKEGVITEGYFIPGWRSSIGASWEHEQLLKLGHTVHDLTSAEIREFFATEHPAEHVDLVMGLMPEA